MKLLSVNIAQPREIIHNGTVVLTSIYNQAGSLQEGEVGAGDIIERLTIGPEQMTVRQVFALLYFDDTDLAAAERALRIPVFSPGWQASFKKLVRKRHREA
jgi:hypothetical protein